MDQAVNRRGDAGFTLVEVLVSIVIEAMIVAALGAAFIGILNSSSQVKTSLSQSGDARIAAAYVVSDAANSSGPEISLTDTTSCADASPPVAGTATPVVRFDFSETSSAGVATPDIVIYYLVSGNLIRRECQNGSLTSDSIVARNVASVTATCSPTANCTGTPISITVTISETAASGSTYQYSLTGAFQKLVGDGAPTNPGPPSSVILLGAGATCSGTTDTISISGSASLRVYGQAEINTANGPSCNALDLAGSGTIQAGGVSYLTGGTCTASGGTTCPPSTTYTTAVTDPYAGLAAPPTTGLPSQTGCSGSQSSQTASPGLYASGFTLGGGDTCTLASGIYVVQNGFNVANGATLKTGTGGVLIYLMSGQFAVAGGASITLTAMTSGTYSGLSLWQIAADTQPVNFSNGGALVFNGAIYAPKSQLQITGNAQTPIVTSLVIGTVNLSNSGGITVGSPSSTPLSISNTTLAGWTVSRPSYSATLTATGGDSNYTWAATTLPAGLSLNTSTGVLSGTPSATGTTSVTFTLTDALGDTPVSKALSVAINAAPTISTATPLTAGEKTAPFSLTLAGSGGTTNYTWAATPLPAGLSIVGSTGVISGTPTATGTTSIGVTLTDAAGATATKTLSLTINAQPTITSVALTNKSGGTAGKMEAGDTITVVYSAQMKVSSFCSTWTSGDTTNQSLAVNNDVTISVTHPGSGNGVLSVASATCTFNFGSINLGSNSYVTAATTFNGSGASASTIAWTASSHTLVITFGAVKTGTVATTAVGSTSPIYTAGALVDTPGGSLSNSPFTVSPAAQRF